MKYLLTLLLLWQCATPASASPTLHKLKAVNVCWNDQRDIDMNTLPAYHSMSETAWIQLHLALVEQTLRKRPVAGLSPIQLKNRLDALDQLKAYGLAGKFPQNEDYAYRTPIFIDKHNTFCAVGYLLKTSGHEDISRMISSATNLAYVKDMQYPQLDQWAADHGFTKDELAWIQPGYPPGGEASRVGDGVDGVVHEMYADDAAGKLYVGGNFVNVDSTIEANNIAYVTEQHGTYTWHSMSGGVNGPVYAIAAYDGKIFVAGHFSQAGDQNVNNVAYWDGASWHGVGCTYGTILDLIVYKNELYASGDFDICAALSEVNVAKWDGTQWQQMPGLDGKVNTMAVLGSDLVLGGSFLYQNDKVNVIRWNAQQHYQSFAAGSAQEVIDLEWYGDTLYAACGHTGPVESGNYLMRLNGNSWTAPAELSIFSFSSPDDEVSLNTLCVSGGNMMIGGKFNYNPGVGIFGQNCITLVGEHIGNGNWFLLDSTVHKMVQFKGELFTGGAFKHGGTMSNEQLNGIARSAVPASTGIGDINADLAFHLYPNPLSGGRLQIENNFGANHLTLTDLAGRNIASLPLRAGAQQQQIQLPSINAGIYMISISNAKGERKIKKVIVK